jgi:CGNR zinc finger
VAGPDGDYSWTDSERRRRLCEALYTVRSVETARLVGWTPKFLADAEFIVEEYAKACAKREKGDIRSVAVPRSAIDRFNALAKRPIQIILSTKHDPLWLPPGAPVPRWRSARDYFVFELMHFFWNSDARRLKRCAREGCGRWFVDESRGTVAKCCSAACTNRKWNRAARRTAEHGRKVKGKSK